MNFTFVSDVSITYKGFRAHYTSFPNDAATPTGLPDGADGNICHINKSSSDRQIVPVGNNTQLLCDTETDGGGWVIFQRRVNGDVLFERTYDSYRKGFGTLEGDFWLGLDNLHLICQMNCEFRVEFIYNGTYYPSEMRQIRQIFKFFNQYTNMSLAGATDKFRISLSGFESGNTNLTAHSFDIVDGAQFTTPDTEPRPVSGVYCARLMRSGWWWKGESCGSTNPNGVWKSPSMYFSIRSITGHYNFVNTTEIKVRVTTTNVDWSKLDTSYLVMDDCVTNNPCVRGTCLKNEGSVSCNCEGTGYTGDTCTTDLDECRTSYLNPNPNPCVRGHCINTEGSFLCNCSGTGYTGNNCTEDVNECEIDNPCIHGTCINTVGSVSCDCQGSGYFGDFCENKEKNCPTALAGEYVTLTCDIPEAGTSKLAWSKVGQESDPVATCGSDVTLGCVYGDYRGQYAATYDHIGDVVSSRLTIRELDSPATNWQCCSDITHNCFPACHYRPQN